MKRKCMRKQCPYPKQSHPHILFNHEGECQDNAECASFIPPEPIPKNFGDDDVMEAIGKAVEVLYALDIKLSNSYTGNRHHSNDKAINVIRRSVRGALKRLESHNWIGSLKDLLKGTI
jgi:hypothetical protein